MHLYKINKGNTTEALFVYAVGGLVSAAPVDIMKVVAIVNKHNETR